jgi:hypothetical protein
MGWFFTIIGYAKHRMFNAISTFIWLGNNRVPPAGGEVWLDVRKDDKKRYRFS